MKYMGSKRRIAKDILPIILQDRKPGQYYVEPFVGGANIIDKVKGPRIGADNNKYLIAMWNGLKDGLERPRKIDKELYSKAREQFNRKKEHGFSDFEIGWIGWMGSFNGRFFDGGYSGTTSTRDYIDEQIRNTESQLEGIKDCEFIFSTYDVLQYPTESLIYCDPPYRNTKQYSTSKDFCHNTFWEWCREMASCGHKIYISEYSAPEDFTCVWEKQVTNSMNTTQTTHPTEKLFTLDIDNGISK